MLLCVLSRSRVEPNNTLVLTAAARALRRQHSVGVNPEIELI